MGAFLHVFSIILTAIGLVHSVEQKLGAGNGLVKKAAVLDPVLNIAGTVGQALGVTPNSSDLTNGVSKVIDGVVSIFNALGIFKHSA